MPKGDFLGEFEIYVLLALTQLGDEAYGNAVRRAIEARTGREIAVGAVYATLGRLEDKGLVRFTLSSPDPVPGGTQPQAEGDVGLDVPARAGRRDNNAQSTSPFSAPGGLSGSAGRWGHGEFQQFRCREWESGRCSVTAVSAT